MTGNDAKTFGGRLRKLLATAPSMLDDLSRRLNVGSDEIRAWAFDRKLPDATMCSHLASVLAGLTGRRRDEVLAYLLAPADVD